MSSIEGAYEERDWDGGRIPSAVSSERFQIEVTEKELMEAIGRSAVSFFTLVHQAVPQPSPLVGVIVIKGEGGQSPDLETPADVVSEVAAKSLTLAVEPAIDGQIEEKVIAEDNSHREVKEASITPEQVHRMIEAYRQQIGVFNQAIEGEHRQQENEEKIRLLQNLNRQSSSANSSRASERLERIQGYEEEIKAVQDKIELLRSTLQEVKV